MVQMSAQGHMPIRRQRKDGKDSIYATIDNVAGFIDCNSSGVSTSEQSVETNVGLEKGGVKQTLTSISCKIGSYPLSSSYAASGSPTPAVNFKASVNVSTGHVTVTAKSGTSFASSILITITVSASIDGATISRDTTLTINGKRKGDTGPEGKRYYPAGTYEDKAYSITDNVIPLVFMPSDTWNSALECMGDYWYLSAETNVVGGVNVAPAETTGNPWTKANDFGVVITQGLFAEFAKLGKGIFSQGYIFSMDGHIGDTDYLDGATVGTTGKPAYLWFKGETPATFAIGKISKTSTQGASAGSPNTLNSGITLMKGMKIKLTVNLKKLTGTPRIALREEGSSSNLVYLEFTSGNYEEKTVTYTASADKTVKIVLYCSSGNCACIGVGTYTFEEVFQPVWWVNLRAGSQGGARDHFRLYANGDVEVEGVVKAKTLYRALALSSGNGVVTPTTDYTSNPPDNGKTCVINIDGESEVWVFFVSTETINGVVFEANTYHTASEIEEAISLGTDTIDWANDVDICRVCTGPAEEVFICDNSAGGNNFAGIVLLPRAEDFPNKKITIRHTTSRGYNSAYIYQVDYAAQKFSYGAYMNGYNYAVSGNLEYRNIVSVGSTAVFQSNGTVWIRIA